MNDPASPVPVAVSRVEPASRPVARVSPRRIWIARGLAVAADAVQLAAFPVTVEGAFSPVSDGIDCFMAVALTLLVGWHIAFIPSFIVKVLPVADLAPTWTLATLIATRGGGWNALPVGDLLSALPIPGLAGDRAAELPSWRVWYDALIKPRWTPSPRTIGRIWTVLYLILFVVDGFLFLQAGRGKLPWPVVTPFAINLAANLAFTPILFGLRDLWLATADVLLVLATIVWAMVVVWPFYPWASVAFVPYAAWVSVAAALQMAIATTNRR